MVHWYSVLREESLEWSASPTFCLSSLLFNSFITHLCIFLPPYFDTRNSLSDLRRTIIQLNMRVGSRWKPKKFVKRWSSNWKYLFRKVDIDCNESNSSSIGLIKTGLMEYQANHGSQQRSYDFDWAFIESRSWFLLVDKHAVHHSCQKSQQLPY